MKRFLLYLLFLLTSLNLTGQVVYPIRTNTVLSQPLPYSLSGFVSEPGKMTLNIFVDDIKLDQYAVKFRVNFEGNGIKISTRPNLYQEPYYLDGGMTHSLTGFELENLMDPDNLIFEGYSRQKYKKDGRLPEGVYRVWIDVIDYYRNVKVAMSTPAIAMIYMAKAPRLSFPVDKAEIDPVLMPSIRFSWFSILPADPLADIAYRFKLYEIRPVGRDPYEVVNVMQPIFQEEVDKSNFTYDLGMPPLMLGNWYVWRVEAFDRENRVKFQNDGYSDVLTFRYGQSCKLPELRINSVENHDVTLAWQPEMNTKDYLLAYKKAKDDQWSEKGTSLSQIKIGGLDDNTGYQVKIKSLCGDEETEFSRIQEFKTPREINYACGKKGDTYDLSNTDPMPTLGRFDEFKAADFIVEVEEVEGGNGNFTGNGYALVPYIGFIKFKVSFENIFVNLDGRMTSGEIKFVYDEATGLVVGGNNGGDDDNDEVEDIDVTEELDKISDKVIESDEEVKDVVVDGDTVVVTYGDGSTKTVKTDGDKKVAIVGGGDGGSAYVADPVTGKVFKTPKKVSGGGKGSSSVGTAAQTGEFGCSIQFSQAKNQRFGFDVVGNGKNKPNSYFKTSKTGEKIPWKSLQSGSSDVLDLTVTGTLSPDSLRYIRNSGLLTPSIPQGKKRQLLLTGLSEGEEDILTVASAKTVATGDSTSREILTEVGALGLITYDRISRDVVLVPVNGAQCPQFAGIINKELNDIYGSAVVDWNVSIQPNLEVDKIKGLVFEHSGTGKFSKYTSHMRQVIKAYKKEHKTDKQSLYLFFIKESTASKTGFMPLASEYGFIFNFRTNTHVLAHELGHGKDFNLRHTFSEKAQHYFPERSTQNLMDYAGGSELWKYQWDLIHDPEKILFSWAQDEKEGAMNVAKMDALFSWLKVNQGNSSVEYNYNKLNKQYVWDFTGKANSFTYSDKTYSTFVWLTNETSKVDLQSPAVDINLSGDFHVEFTLMFKFTDSSDEAIKLTTYTYQDFSAILGRIGISLSEENKTKIAQDYSSLFGNSELTLDCDKIDVLFEGIPDFVLDNISGKDRVNYIKTLLSCVVNEGGWIAGKRFDTNEELALLNLFRNFPSTETPDEFLKLLGSNKIGEEPLVKILISSVDNKYLFIGDDSRKLLMMELLSLFSKTQTYLAFNEDLDAKLNASSIDPEYARKLSEKTIAFDYRSIYARTWLHINPSIVDVDLYTKISVDFNSEGKVKLNTYMCYGFISGESPNIKNPRELDPFEAVIFDQKSTLGALDGFDKVFIAPAIFAYYADKEAGIKTATDVTQAGIDVGTLMIPGGQLTKLGRLFFYADKISSVTSLAAGFAGINESNENLKNVLSGISLITGIASIGENFAKPSISTDVFNKSKSVLQADFKKIVNDINKLTPDELKQIEKTCEKLANFVNAYRKEVGLSEEITEEAVKRLNGISDVGVKYTDADITLLWGNSSSRFNKSRKALNKNGLLDEFRANYPELTDLEILSVYRYTATAKDLNNPLNKVPTYTMTEKLVAHKKVLDAALDKLIATKAYDGIVYRGANLDESFIVSKYKNNIGKEITEDAFTSTSKLEEVADDFIKKFLDSKKTPVKYTINSKTGIDINDMSHYNRVKGDDQAEILFKSGQDFMVESVEKNSKGVYEIFMSEL
jgi:hypothetical protein